MTRIALLVLMSLFLALAVTPAEAHIKCWPKGLLMKFLTVVHKEAVVIRGVDSGGWPIEFWRSRDGASWSFVTYRPPGMACVLSTGKAFTPRQWIEPKGDPA